jgi:hypothetical protein
LPPARLKEYPTRVKQESGTELTPVIAIDLEKGSKGAMKEMFSVMRTYSVPN